MMELIKIVENEKCEQLVSARDLYNVLGLDKSNIKRWIKLNIIDDEFFTSNVDYTIVLMTNPNSIGIGAKVETYDYIMKLDMAKHLCMISRTAKAKEIRDYFIECEKQLKELSIPSYQISDPIARAKAWIQEQEKNKNELEIKDQIIIEYKPKADYFDEILKSQSLLTISQIAKDYGLSGQALNKILHEEGIQYKQSDQWLLYVKHCVQGYTKSETVKYNDSQGTEKTKLHTKWKQKGRIMIHGLLEKRGIKANIDEATENWSELDG